MNLLLAVDRSSASEKAVQFVGELCGNRDRELTITLFHVIESLPDYLVERSEHDPSSIYRQVADDWTRTAQEEGEALLEEMKQSLEGAKVAATSIETKLVSRPGLPEAKKVVAALAIIEEMKSGAYSVVCVGRRSTASPYSLFLGSVAEKVLREAAGTTVWVVD